MQNLMPLVNTPDNLFHDGNPVTGELGTIVEAEHLNNEQSAIRDVQSEMISVLAAAGIEVDPDKQDQLLTAMKAILLSRVNPFADIAADGPEAIATALANLGLGTAATKDVGIGANQIPDMNAFAASRASWGYQKLPGGIIIQWGAGNAGVGSTAGSGNTINFPVAFPSMCFQVVTSYDNGGSTVVAGAAGAFTTTGFLLRCAASSGSYNFRWLAVGV